MITKFNLQDRTIVSYAIRKLTSKECFRLMGVPDATIARMQQTRSVTRKIANPEGVKVPCEVEEMIVSASQQYRQAGNSIVTNCLVNLYEAMFYPQNVAVACNPQALDPLAEEKAYIEQQKTAIMSSSSQLTFFDSLFS